MLKWTTQMALLINTARDGIAPTPFNNYPAFSYPFSYTKTYTSAFQVRRRGTTLASAALPRFADDLIRPHTNAADTASNI